MSLKKEEGGRVCEGGAGECFLKIKIKSLLFHDLIRTFSISIDSFLTLSPHF